MYHEVIKLGREVMIEQGLTDPSLSLEENPPGRGRGSSVALLIGYLIGLSHIDPLKYKLSLERFLPEDTMNNVPDIDLDFPRSIREYLILKNPPEMGLGPCRSDRHYRHLSGQRSYPGPGQSSESAGGRSRPAFQTVRLGQRQKPGIADAEIAPFPVQDRTPRYGAT